MVHHVFANRSNVGDWLSARAIQSLLPRDVPIREYACDDYFIDATLAALAEVGPEDFVIIGGGGLLMDYFLPFWRGFETLAPRLTFGIWGVGCCENKSRSSRLPADLIRGIVARSRFTFVRDELTRRYLAMPDHVPPPVHCPSLLQLDPPAQKGQKLLHAVHYEVTGPDGYERMCALCRDFAGATDRPYLETNNEIETGSIRQLAGTVRLYAESDLVVSTRLHGCIIGLAMGCKVLAVSGDEKVEAFMKCAGLERWVCDIARMDELPAWLGGLESQPPATDFIERARAENRRLGAYVGTIVAEHHRSQRQQAQERSAG